jgi:hypothetical protein
MFSIPALESATGCAPQLFGVDADQSIARLVGVLCDMIEPC